MLLHLDSKTYYSLNPTGERIWQGLKEGLSLREISRRLQEEFDVTTKTAARSVLDLVKELCEQKLALSDTEGCVKRLHAEQRRYAASNRSRYEYCPPRS